MRIVFAIVGLFGALAASADSYLYWMVDTANISSQYTYDTVKVAEKTSSGEVSYMTLTYGDGVTSAGESVSKSTAVDYATAGLGFYAQLMSSPSTCSYAIELFNGSTYVAQSEGGWVNYADLANYVVSSPMSAPVAAWTPAGGSYGVPEPNSALLVLIGCAALGLKRKKKPQA